MDLSGIQVMALSSIIQRSIIQTTIWIPDLKNPGIQMVVWIADNSAAW